MNALLRPYEENERLRSSIDLKDIILQNVTRAMKEDVKET